MFFCLHAPHDTPACRSLSASVLQFLCGLMALLPQQLTKLVRRKAAFATECLVPAAALAKVCGSSSSNTCPVGGNMQEGVLAHEA
jgi:hypothetical protein